MPVQSSPRSLWALTLVFALATMLLGSWFSRVVPATGCSMPPQRGVTALLAFQMARTPADMEAVFGREGDPCRPGMVAALDRANTVDLYGFIWTYGAFLLCFLLAIGRGGGGPAARLGIGVLVAGLGLDVLETATQLRLTGELPGTASALQTLAIGSTGKYIALSLVTLCAGVAMVTPRRHLRHARGGRLHGRQRGSVRRSAGAVLSWAADGRDRSRLGGHAGLRGGVPAATGPGTSRRAPLTR